MLKLCATVTDLQLRQRPERGFATEAKRDGVRTRVHGVQRAGVSGAIVGIGVGVRLQHARGRSDGEGASRKPAAIEADSRGRRIDGVDCRCCGHSLGYVCGPVLCRVFVRKAVLCNVLLNRGFLLDRKFARSLARCSLRLSIYRPLSFLLSTSVSLASMFRSFRKKAVKEPVEEPVRKTSLPDIASQDVQWPEDLVDIAAIRHTPPPEHQLQGAAPISFQPDEPGATSFHKPFRRFPGRSHDGGDRSISAIYMSHPPSAFHTPSGPPTRVGQRRARVPPKFNLMVSVRKAPHVAPCVLTNTV